MNHQTDPLTRPSDIIVFGAITIAIAAGGAHQLVIYAWIAALMSFAATSLLARKTPPLAFALLGAFAITVIAATAWQAAQGAEARELFYTGNLLLPLAAQAMRLKNMQARGASTDKQDPLTTPQTAAGYNLRLATTLSRGLTQMNPPAGSD